MSDNLNQFLNDLDEIENEFIDEINNKIIDVASEIYLALLEPRSVGGTPVQTSWLRSNWIFSINSERSGTVGSRESIDTATQDAAFNFLKNSDLSKVNKIYINNNVWYGGIVNYETGGMGGQSLLFVERSILRGLEKI